MKISNIQKLNSLENRNTYASSNLGLAGKGKEFFSCNKTIVGNTLNNKGMSFGGFDRNLKSDVFERGTQNDNNNNIFSKKMIVKNTLNKNISFGGPFPQFLIEQDEAISCDSKSCSFNGGLDSKKSANVLSKIYYYFRDSLSV